MKQEVFVSARKGPLGIEMLPVVHELIESELGTAKEQLVTLEAVKNQPYKLDDHAVERLRHLYNEKLQQNPDLRGQCQRWHNEPYLSERQKKMLYLLGQDLAALEKVSQQIFFLAQHFYDHTIDKVLAKDDDTLTRDTLTGKAYLPEPLPALVEEIKAASASLSTTQKNIIKTIHEKMTAIKQLGGNEAEMIMSMMEHMPIIETLFSTSEHALNYYFARYPGFYDYMLLLENLSEGIENGDFEEMLKLKQCNREN